MAQGDRVGVRLRQVVPDDFPALFVMYTDSTSAWMAAFASDDPDDFPAFEKRWRRLLSSRDVIVQAIEVDGSLCGTVSAWPEGDVLYTAYWVDRSCWGRGLATEALGLLLETLPRPVHARVAHDNIASQRVLEKVGFRRIGHDADFADARQELTEECVYVVP